MAGITSSFPFKPLLTRTSTKTTLSPLESKLFGVRLLCYPYAIKSNSSSVSSNLTGSITARYGGGFRPSGSGNSKRFRKSDSDEDQALDISTIRSDKVRLIDDKQNMVGVVPKSEAIQMAVDAELDLVILSPDADPPVLKIMDYKFQKSY